MVKKYTKNIKLEFAYQKVFSNIDTSENISIHDVITLVSGDNLPKSKMKEGAYSVYGGGGATDNKHNDYNIDYSTIGIGRVGARCGCIFEIKSNSWITDNALYIKAYDERFYLPYLKHFLSFSNLNQYANNAMQPVISKTRIKSITIPFIDYDKQKDIARLLDNIEVDRDCNIVGFEEILNNVRIVDDWKRLVKEIETQQTLLKKLRQSILQEAIEGKLTASWRKENPNIESASVLLENIKAEKEELIKAKKIKKQKPLAPISEDEIPFDSPDGWVWCRLGGLMNLITDGAHHTPTYTESGVHFLSVKDVAHGKINLSNTRYISEEEHIELTTRCHPEYGDLLLTKVGTTGIAKVVDIEKEFSLFVSVALLKFNQTSIYNYFLENLINSPYVKKQSDNGTKGMGNKNLVIKTISNFLVSIPPLKEQKQIVRKIESLFKICDELEIHINTSKENTQRLMQSVLKEAFENK